MTEFSLLVVAVIIGMSVVTYVTKAGGLWVLDRVDLSDEAQVGLEALPGGIIVAVLVARLKSGGPPEWTAALAVLWVAHYTDNVLLALVTGTALVVLFRGGF